MNAAPRFPVEAALALHGRIFAMLSADEMEVLAFYRQQGRKFGIDAHIDSVADPVDLEQARSKIEADEVMRRSNSTVSVTRRHW
ncbi:MAG: hypothetical protein AB7S56_01205 [Halothiobacillaceae bacterium]